MTLVEMMIMVLMLPVGAGFSALLSAGVPELKPAAPLITLLIAFAAGGLVIAWRGGAFKTGASKRLVLHSTAASPLRAGHFKEDVPVPDARKCPPCGAGLEDSRCPECGLAWGGATCAIPIQRKPAPDAGPPRFSLRGTFWDTASGTVFGGSVAGLCWWAVFATLAAIARRPSDWHLWALLIACLPVMGGIGTMGLHALAEGLRNPFISEWLERDGTRVRVGFTFGNGFPGRGRRRTTAVLPLADIKGVGLFFVGGGGHGIYRVVLLHASGLNIWTPWQGGPKDMTRLGERLDAWLAGGPGSA